MSLQPLTKKQQELCETNLPLAYYHSFPYSNACRRFEDEFCSAGFQGLVEACSSYRQENGVFATFASRRIIGSLNDEYREHFCLRGFKKKTLRELAPGVMHQSYKSNIVYGPKILPDQTFVTYDSFEGIIRNIDYRARHIIRGIYLDNLTQTVIAKRMKLSRSRVSVLYTLALQELRFQLRGTDADSTSQRRSVG